MNHFFPKYTFLKHFMNFNLINLFIHSKKNEKIHLRSAQRLKKVFCQNGGAFIKVGQHIGGLDYLLPNEYVKTMKQLHDKAPESNLSELYETIETDLKCKVSLLLICEK